MGPGALPGDGRPKPIAFPDPATTAIHGSSFALLPLPRYLDLKLASDISAPHRLHDPADVLERARSAGLSPDLAEELHPWARKTYREPWNADRGEDLY